jgi:hypothetical protein
VPVHVAEIAVPIDVAPPDDIAAPVEIIELVEAAVAAPAMAAPAVAQAKPTFGTPLPFDDAEFAAEAEDRSVGYPSDLLELAPSELPPPPDDPRDQLALF